MEPLGARSLRMDGGRGAAVRSREAVFVAFAGRRLAESYRLAAVILGDPSEAQDATHDAFELAWRRWDTLRDPGRLDAWFGRILINVCRDRLRQRKRRTVRDVSLELGESIAAGDAFRGSVDRDEIARAFARLNEDQRLVVVLRFYADLPLEAIAERVGAPLGTVKSRLHYALAELNAALRDGRAGRPGR
jgi:RNA polymerase sigma-70 factor (ECF subfamily)